MTSQTLSRKETVPASNLRIRSIFVGILILLAYSMLIYDVSGNIPFGATADIISGLAVIGIGALCFPLFLQGKEGIKSRAIGNKVLCGAYLFSRTVEGVLMVIAGICILSSSTQTYRALIYNNFHIYFFVSGALLFYYLLLRTRLVPKALSVWGLLATVVLIIMSIIVSFGYDHPILKALALPMMLNEFVLAIWLMVKGFHK